MTGNQKIPLPMHIVQQCCSVSFTKHTGEGEQSLLKTKNFIDPPCPSDISMLSFLLFFFESSLRICAYSFCCGRSERL